LAKVSVREMSALRSIPALALAAFVVAAGSTAAVAADETAEPTLKLVQGNVEEAIAGYTEALKNTGLANDRRASILNDRAVAYVRSGKPKLAFDDYNRALKAFAEYPAVYNNRGNLLLSLGQYHEAIKDFDRAILLAPGYAAAYSNRGNARLKLGDRAAAIGDFTKAIELMPASAAPLSGRGLAYLDLGKPHAAIRDFSRAVNSDARFASAYRNRAEARLAVGQSDIAIEDLSRAIAFDVNNPEIYVVRGYAYLSASNTESAIKDFAHAIELDPRLVAAYQGRGLSNGLLEAYDEAYADLNRAIELDPRSAVSFAYRAFVYKQNGQIDIAQRDLQTAGKLDSTAPEAIWVRGELAEARGLADEAVASYQKVLALRPDWRLAGEGLKRLGADESFAEEREVPGAGVDSWKVMVRGNSYFAISADYPSLRVPLEMIGAGNPKLTAWEMQPAPHQGYGILRFFGGKVAGKTGLEDTELAAIIDINDARVIAIQPNKQGARVAKWTWEDDRVQIASVDGVTDEYAIRSVKPPAYSSVTGVRRSSSHGDGFGGAWAPWDQPLGLPRSNQRSSRKSYKKPKTLFDLLFN
jgi:tetratricopeptide (TPR) repeat protein